MFRASSGVPIAVVKTWQPSSLGFGPFQRFPTARDSLSWRRRCSRRPNVIESGRASVRRLRAVFNGTSWSLPSIRCSWWRTWSVLASRSTSSQQRPSASPWRRLWGAISRHGSTSGVSESSFTMRGAVRGQKLIRLRLADFCPLISFETHGANMDGQFAPYSRLKVTIEEPAA